MNPSQRESALRLPALAALVFGAVGCEYLTFRMGHRNPSVVLGAMFAAWVLAPFAALAWCHVVAKRWAPTVRAALQFASLLVALGSLAVYGDVAFGPSRSQPVFFFLVLPFVSLVLTAVLGAVGARTRDTA